MRQYERGQNINLEKAHKNSLNTVKVSTKDASPLLLRCYYWRKQGETSWLIPECCTGLSRPGSGWELVTPAPPARRRRTPALNGFCSDTKCLTNRRRQQKLRFSLIIQCAWNKQPCRVLMEPIHGNRVGGERSDGPGANLHGGCSKHGRPQLICSGWQTWTLYGNIRFKGV